MNYETKFCAFTWPILDTRVPKGPTSKLAVLLVRGITFIALIRQILRVTYPEHTRHRYLLCRLEGFQCHPEIQQMRQCGVLEINLHIIFAYVSMSRNQYRQI